MSSSVSYDDLMQEYEISRLVVRERYYRDTAQWENLRSCYHPDTSKTSIKITWFNGDVDRFVAGSEKMAVDGATSTHTVTPALIHRHNSKAVAESVGSILSRFEHNGVEYDLASYARFVSRLEKVDSAWKIVTLEAIYERDTIHPAQPGTGQIIPGIDSHGRSNYRCLAWLLKQKGFVVDPNLPGSDIAGSAERLLKKCFVWLRGID